MEALEMLKKQGVTLESMTDTGFALYVGEDGQQALKKLKDKFQELVKKNLNDPNVSLLVEAAAHLDQVVRSESAGIFKGSKDPTALVADELIGMSIAEYIAGKKGLFNYVRYDRSKPGILAKLPPFLDDAVAALVAASMTRLFEE